MIWNKNDLSFPYYYHNNNMTDKILAEVCGKVSYINHKNKKFFTLHAEKMDKKFRCILNYENVFCPLREGDAVFAVAEYYVDSRYGDTLNIIQPPFVYPGEDKNTLIKSFTTALRGTGFGTMKSESLYNLLNNRYNNITEATKEIDKLASYFNYENGNDMTLLSPFLIVLKEKQMLKLLQWWYKNRNLRRLYLLGLNNRDIKGTKQSPEKIYETCLDNPYTLYNLDISKCDSIMLRIGKPIDQTIRKCAIISRTINKYMDEKGWSGIPTNILKSLHPDVAQYINTLKEVFKVKTELHTVYLPYAHEVETGICDLVKDLLDSPTLSNSIRPSEIVFTRNDLSDAQIRAVENALSDNISIITGYAGTGKTTVIKELVYNLHSKGIKYKVVSFTGKAVARIREVIEQKEPMTMHMSLTLNTKKNNEFEHLIIDEASMVTSGLFYEFMSKFGHDYRITLVGDPNQLQPISWGNFLDQLIRSGIVPA